MHGELIIHIGPPKTATTSLQMFLQDLQIEGFTYSGVTQPRSKRQSSISDRLLEICGSKDIYSLKNRKKIKLLKIDLSNILTKNKVVVLSEEMFLHSNKQNIFIQKLRNLKIVVGDYLPKIVFCVRDPAEALPSYFQEIFFDLPHTLRNDFNEFQRSYYAGCYRYKNLIEVLENIGFTNLHWIDFRKLHEGNMRLSDLLGNHPIKSGLVHDPKIIIKKSNVSEVLCDERIFVRKNLLFQRINMFIKEKFETISYFHRFKPGNLFPLKEIKFSKKLTVRDDIKRSFRMDLDYLNKRQKIQ